MNTLDFIVLFGTMISIVAYGTWKTRGSKGLQGYLLGDKSMKWGTIGLSVMATQASAITFLSTPGQGYEDGMGFIQIYFGMPFAIIIIAAYVVPMYHKLKVFTPYEYLETRFDLKSRALTAFIFLISRGLAAGITIYAPAIILSSILKWDINYTILIIGILVIIYTVSGGTKAVAVTQKYQMLVIMAGMAFAFFILLSKLPENISFDSALTVATGMGKMEAIDLNFDPTSRYNIWSGLFAGIFLSLAYFGADQSQVQRYLSGKSVKEIRAGLLFNGIFKIPMQYSILLIGVLVFVFYQFTQPPVFFNQAGLLKGHESKYESELIDLESRHANVFEQKKQALEGLLAANNDGNTELADRFESEANKLNVEQISIENQVTEILQKVDPDIYEKDADYVFITFVINYLPHGIIGLLMAVIFSAAMSSTASELSALGSTTTIDFYKRMINPDGGDKQNLFMSRMLTVFWGILALLFAIFASQLDNLIQAVNILGSVFYGPLLGIFIVAFAVKHVKANAVFIATIISELFIIALYFMTRNGSLELGYLWFNPIGALLVVFLAMLVQLVISIVRR
ncbi:MAG: sodium:solute symporter [Bacteroidota bacterium]